MKLFNFIKYMFVGAPKFEITVPDYEIWYNRETRLWTAQFKDDDKNQIGNAGYGATKEEAKNDLFYQNIDIIK